MKGRSSSEACAYPVAYHGVARQIYQPAHGRVSEAFPNKPREVLAYLAMAMLMLSLTDASVMKAVSEE